MRETGVHLLFNLEKIWCGLAAEGEEIRLVNKQYNQGGRAEVKFSEKSSQLKPLQA